MRIVHSEAELEAVYQNAVNEAKASFGDDRMYVEKYIASAKHIEVQVLGDEHGHLLHLFERDCSVQRRQQKWLKLPQPWHCQQPCGREFAKALLI